MVKISQIKDNIIKVTGKEKYSQNQIFKLDENCFGIVLTAKQDKATLLVYGDKTKLTVGKTIEKYAMDNFVNLYEEYFGSIISPIGQIIHPDSSKKPSKLLGKSHRLNKSPAILDRRPLDIPLETGIFTIDTMIPIGKGQRELIIGDRNTGKTSIAINMMVSQAKKNTKTIYVAVGQKRNSITNLFNLLKSYDALENTIIIFSNPTSPAEQYLAPTIGMAMAESLAYTGEDVLIIFDDLTKHANICREISLSIGKSPGREAFPTNIFSEHSSLLERSGKFSNKYNKGTITAIPIVETVQGDLASLIPSNIISITDGQIFTNVELFNKGEFPSIDIHLSVSRTGSAVQSKLLRKVSKGLKTEISLLAEVKKLADISVNISESLSKKIEKWDQLNNLLIQTGYEGYSNKMIAILLKLFRMDKFKNIQNSIDFYNAFINYCKQDQGAKIIIEKINEENIDTKEIEEQIEFIFTPLTDAASGVKGGIVSEKEFAKLKEVKNG